MEEGQDIVQQEQQRPWPVDRAKVGLWLLGTLALIALLWVLWTASVIFIPLTAAFFVAVGVAPVGAWVRRRVPARLSWLGHVAAMLVVLGVMAAFFGSLWFVAQRVVEEFPKYAGEVQRLWGEADGWVEGTKAELLGPAAEGGGAGGETTGGEEGGGQSDPISGWVMTLLSSVQYTASMLVLIVFLALLMLMEAPVWQEKIARTLGRDSCGKATDAVAAISQQFRRYLVVSSVLGIITGVLYILWLSLFGLDFVLLWGLLAFLLNFIPLAGSLVAGVLPVMLALVQKDWGTALMVGAGIMVIEQVMGNLVAPRMEGRQLAISPLVIMVSLLLWNWLWGAAGALLAPPIAVMIAITLSHVEALRPFAIFLSDRSDVERFEAHTRPD